jgi:hypothetical protein
MAAHGPGYARIAAWLDRRHDDGDDWLEVRREPDALRLYTLAGDGSPNLLRSECLSITAPLLNTLMAAWPSDLRMPERRGIVVCGWLTPAPVWPDPVDH